MKYFLFTVFAFITFSLSSLPISANDIVLRTKDTIRDESIQLPETLGFSMDTLLSDWMNCNGVVMDTNCIHQSHNPSFSDSVYIDRLSKLPSVMELPYNQIVRTYINLYAERLRERVSYMLGVGKFFFPLFDQALDAENLPLELRYLPVIESALNPTAVSKVGAAGLWQFMLPTARSYGLEVSNLIDERRDPVKSTYAAVKYLKELNRIYDDWGLAIAAYNCGPGNVNKAIRRAGGKKDYWDIYFYLPKETRGYLPAFIAVNYVMNYATQHNICMASCKIPLNTDTVEVNQMMHFQQIADVLNLPVEQIRMLNPQYRRDIIPGHTKSCTLRLPIYSAYAFIDSKDTIAKYRSAELLLNFRKTVDPGTPEDNTVQISIRHKIKRGETISEIARKYRVSVKEIKSWNHLRSSSLHRGRMLTIYREKRIIAPITTEKRDDLAKNSKKNLKDSVMVSAVSDTLSENTDEQAEISKPEKKSKHVSKVRYLYRTVRKGDTLWAIANKYPGITVDDIMKANKLRRHDAIQVGMKIKIPKS